MTRRKQRQHKPQPRRRRRRRDVAPSHPPHRILTPLPPAPTPPATLTTPQTMQEEETNEKKYKKDDDDKLTAKAKSKARKENKIQKPHSICRRNSEGDARHGNRASRVKRPTRGDPFESSSKNSRRKPCTGKDDEKEEPLMVMSQWKALLESNNKASSLPPTTVKPGLFTAACEKVKTTPRQILQLVAPATAASINTAPSVSTTREEALSALKSNLKVADGYTTLSLSSGYTLPPDTERVLKQAALNCA